MTGFLDSMPPLLRRLVLVLCGAAFVLVVFVWAPIWAAEFNQARDWPRWTPPGGRVLGVALFLGGLGLVLYCSRLFARRGRGTPIPIDPPRQLVLAGIYRWTRNPMYIGQVGILLGYFLYFGEIMLLVHALIWALLVHGFVVYVEEPGLRRRFGDAYLDYTRRVPRWLGLPRTPPHRSSTAQEER